MGSCLNSGVYIQTQSLWNNRHDRQKATGDLVTVMQIIKSMRPVAEMEESGGEQIPIKARGVAQLYLVNTDMQR